MKNIVMRFSLGFVFGWFGISEIISPTYFSGYIPPFVRSLSSLDSGSLIQVHGAALAFLSVCLFLNLKLRVAGLISIIMLAQIIGGLLLTSGFNEIVVRDIGLLGLAISIWLQSLSLNK